MGKIAAIAANTFKEAIRDKILYGFLFFAVMLILFSLVLGQLSIDQQIRCTLDIGLAGISFFSVLISIFLGITLLYKEIEKRTIYPVLAKPVSRTVYLIGKFLGLGAVMSVQIALMVIVFLGVLLSQNGHLTMGILFCVVLIFIETLLIISMALFFTSFSSPFLSGIFCLGIFAAGRNVNLIAELGKHKSMQWMTPLLDGITAVLPNLYLFYPGGKIVDSSWATVHEQFVSTGYMASTIAYGLLYTGAFLALSILLLGKRDFT